MREELDIPMPAMGPANPGSFRVPRRRADMDPNTKRLALFAGGIGGTILLLVGAYSLAGRHNGGVPVVEPLAGPVRVKPDNPGGMQVAGSDSAIMSGTTTGRAALAPPSEAPAPQALRDQPATPPVAPAVATNAPQAQTVSLSPAVPSAAPPQPRVAPKPVVARGGMQVQLGALGSEQAAMAEWDRLSKKMPDGFGGRKPVVVKVEHDGKTFWRLRTTGFADATQAAGFCEKVKAKGGNCAVAGTS